MVRVPRLGPHGIPESQRDFIIQPRVARFGLPWEPAHSKSINPERVESIPHIPLVKGDVVAPQEAAKLILKRNLPVMLLLPGNVGAHVIHLRLPNGENAVAGLPCKIGQIRCLRLHPSGRTAL